MSPLALVVEDEAALRDIYNIILRKRHYDILEAGDGEQALHLLASHEPQVILLDMLLPYKDGAHIIDYLVANDRLGSLLIIIITAHARFAHYAGPNIRFLRKPIRPSDLDSVLP